MSYGFRRKPRVVVMSPRRQQKRVNVENTKKYKSLKMWLWVGLAAVAVGIWQGFLSWNGFNKKA